MTSEHVAGEPVTADRSGLGYLIGYAARLLWTKLAGRVTDLGLDSGSYIVLVNVAILQERTGSGPVMRELAGSLALDPGAVEDAVRRLVPLGLVSLSTVEGTERLEMTPKGVAMMPALMNEARWLLESVLSGFTYEEIDTFRDYLRRAIENLGGHAE